jgi:hypothetical protein
MVLVHGHRVVIVEGNRSSLRDELWAILETDGADGQLLDALTRGGIGSAPGFALCTVGADELSMVLRGALRFESSSGEEIDARRAATWVERRLPEQPGWLLDGGGNGEWLPLIGGVVAAGAVRSVASDGSGTRVGDAPAVIAAPVSPAEPAPEPVAASREPRPDPPVNPEATIVPTRTVDHPPTAIAPPPAAEAVPDNEYDHLFGATVIRSIEDAAVRVDEDAADEPDGEPDDGSRTVVATDIAALRAQRRAERAGAQPAFAVAAPRFSLRAASGPVESLTDIVLIGRAPAASRVPASRVPRLVTVASKDVSRTHVQVEVSGDAVVVTDLHSSNGTMIVLPGQSPQRLRSGEPTTVIPGTVIDLGDGVQFTLEVER